MVKKNLAFLGLLSLGMMTVSGCVQKMAKHDDASQAQASAQEKIAVPSADKKRFQEIMATLHRMKEAEAKPTAAAELSPAPTSALAPSKTVNESETPKTATTEGKESAPSPASSAQPEQ